MRSGEAPDLQALLDHSEWLRGLARRLVPPGIAEDDLLQETWLAAIRRPPRDARNLRGWLATVARNAGRQLRRSEARRAFREAAAPAAPRPPDPAAIVARAEIQRAVADAVLELEEPHRTLIVLRFYEGRESREMARMLGIAPATVRSRQRRAIERLRERLDRECGGDRRAWCLPLLALGRRRDAPAVPRIPAAWPLALLLASLGAILLLRPTGDPPPDPDAATRGPAAAIGGSSTPRHASGPPAGLSTPHPTRGAVGPIDLAAAYPATLEHREDPAPVEWTASPRDVWSLSSFRYRLGDLSVDIGPAEVVFGVAEGNVVWAALFPRSAGSVGHSETGVEPVASIWLRFHPTRVGELFPASTVRGRGSPRTLLAGLRLHQYRIRGCLQIEDTPVIPRRDWLVIDADTTTGARRFFEMDTATREVSYPPYFATRAAPPPPVTPVPAEVAAAAFDRAWRVVDEIYPLFGRRPDLDWDLVRVTLRPLAVESGTAHEAASVVALALRRLEDLQASVRLDGATLPAYNRRRTLNMLSGKTLAHLESPEEFDAATTRGRTIDGIGYVRLLEFTGPGQVETFDAILDDLADTRGLILDLRACGGGDESAAVDVAGRFLARSRVYARRRTRCGPEHDDLGDPVERRCAPRGPWRYRQPVMLLQGMKTFGTAESFVLMLRGSPGVTTIGDRTAGSSGHAVRHEVGAGIVVSVPTILDGTPDGRPIDRGGVAPDVRVPMSPWRDPPDDPVMLEALRRLRSR